MENLELHPISVGRVKNRLADDIKHRPTATYRELHSKLLRSVEAMEKDLAALEDSITELEDAYASLDAEEQRKREREIKGLGRDSASARIRKGRLKSSDADRLPAREIAFAISEQMDKAFKNYLDSGVSPAELKAAAEAGVGALPGAGLLTLIVNIFRSIDKAIDRLGAETDKSEQYPLKLEIFQKVVESFAALFRTLQGRVETRLKEFE